MTAGGRHNPRVIEFVVTLPKTFSGSIRRVELREKDMRRLRRKKTISSKIPAAAWPPVFFLAASLQHHFIFCLRYAAHFGCAALRKPVCQALLVVVIGFIQLHNHSVQIYVHAQRLYVELAH